jgi:hypothetical protein
VRLRKQVLGGLALSLDDVEESPHAGSPFGERRILSRLASGGLRKPYAHAEGWGGRVAEKKCRKRRLCSGCRRLQQATIPVQIQASPPARVLIVCPHELQLFRRSRCGRPKASHVADGTPSPSRTRTWCISATTKIRPLGSTANVRGCAILQSVIERENSRTIGGFRDRANTTGHMRNPSFATGVRMLSRPLRRGDRMVESNVSVG